MKFLYSIFFISFLALTSCQKQIDSIFSASLDPKVQFQKEIAPLRIGVMNKQNKDPLTISDEIIFSGFVQSGLFNHNQVETDKDKVVLISASEDSKSLMNVSTRCTSNGKNFIFDQEFSKYRFNFSVIELLPDSLLLEDQNSKISCSFFFSIQDKNLLTHYFSLTQVPMKDLHKQRHLFIKGKHNENLGLSLNKTIGRRDINNFFLIHKDSKDLTEVRFICAEWIQETSFNSVPSVTPIFRLLQSRNDLPAEEQECRIVTSAQNRRLGVTTSFRVDFSQFKNEVAPFDLTDIQLQIVSKTDFYSKGKWDFWISEIQRKLSHQDDQRVLERIKNRKYFSLSDSLVFENLPKDFKEKQYELVSVYVQTECKGELFKNRVYEKGYEFPLTSEISLMSVLPLDMLQIYYNPQLKKKDRYTLKSATIGKMLKEWVDKKDEQESPDLGLHSRFVSSCSHKVSLKNDRNQELHFHPIYQETTWSPSGFGISFDSSSLRKGYPTFLDEVEGQLSFDFMRQVATHENSLKSFQLPDKLTLMCGRDFEEVTEVLSVPIEASVFSISTSILFHNNSVFVKLLNEKLALKCRTLLYKGKNLKYFSPEIQILSNYGKGYDHFNVFRDVFRCCSRTGSPSPDRKKQKVQNFQNGLYFL